MRHRVELAALIEAITVAHPRAYWLERLGAHDIPCGPINTYDEVTRDPQIVARNMVVTTNHPVLGRLRTLGSPLKMSDTPTIADRPAPLLGEHTEQVLLGAGYTEPELAALRDAGAIG